MPEEPAGERRSVWDRLAEIPDLEPGEDSSADPSPPQSPPPAPSPPTPPRPAAPAPASPGPAGAPTGPADGGAAGPAADRTEQYDRRSIRVAPGAPPPQPAPRPVPAPPAGDDVYPPAEPRPPRRRGRRWGRWVVAVLGVLVLAMGALWLYAVWAWSSIDRVDTAGSLSSGDDFTNYLVVGTDSRETFDPDDPAADDVGLGFEGSRSDSMMVLHIGPSGNHIVSLPRDLRVNIPGAGQNKLNAALSIGGAPLLIQTVQTELQIPIHRYLEVDLAGFMAVVDAVDGITVDFPAPACDVKSGLMIRTSGPVLLDSRQALAYVRSRSYVEFDAAPAEGLGCQQILSAGLGAPVGSDLDRTARQRDFLLDTLAKAGRSRNPLTLISVLDGLSGGLRVDDEMSMRDAISLARKARGLDAETHGLPVADSGNDLVMTGDAGAVLDLFRSGG